MLKIFISFLFISSAFSQQNQEEYKKMVEQLMKMKAENQTSSQNQFEALIKKTGGSVWVKPSEDSEFKSIDDSGYYPLDPDDTVKTGSDGYAEIYFSDRGMIKLSRNSELEIRTLEQDDSSVFLKIGALVAKFESKVKKKLFFKVNTPAAVCAVRGTEFAAEHSAFNKESSFGVFDEGELAVSSLDKDGKPSEEIKVEKNQEIVLSPQIKRLKTVRMSRLAKHKNLMTEVKKRFPLYKKRWRPMDFQRREKMRAALLKRKIKDSQEEETSAPDKKKPLNKHNRKKRGV